MAKQWSLVSGSGCPTARSGHCVTVAKDNMYMFGGCGLPGKNVAAAATDHVHVDEEQADGMLPICLGDLHVYNVARQRWKEVVFAAGKPRPAPRTCAAICAAAEEDRLFLSGGAGDDPYDLRGDLLQYDVRERGWTVLYDGGSAPALGPESCPFRRIGHTMVHHPASNRLVLFGGSTGLEYFDDTHAFDLATGRWTLVATTGDRPSPRYKHQAFVDADFMYIVGGGSYEPEGPDLDVYRLSLATGGGGGDESSKPLQWERLKPTGTPPRCRAAHGLAWDHVGRAAYIWGGFTSGMELDSTFCALRLPPLPPPAAMVAASSAVKVDSPTAVGKAGAPASTTVASLLVPPGSTTSSGAAAAVEVTTHESPEPVEFTGTGREGGGSRAASRRIRRTLSADAAGLPAVATAVVESARSSNKPSGSADGARERPRHRASASGTELAEQQQWQWQQQDQANPRHEERQQQQQEQEQEQQEQQPPTLSSPEREHSRGSPQAAYGRERWRRRGQRLWRQRSGGDRDGSSEGRGGCGSNTRRPRESRRRPWGQGWATGRLQGLWGGGGGGGGGDGGGSSSNASSLAGAQHRNHASAIPSSLTTPPLIAPAGAQLDGATPPSGAVPAGQPENTTAETQSAAVGQEMLLSWVTLPSSGEGGSPAACGTREEGGARACSPAGRSFHCAFFHGGAYYVTGGSDGARKFGDMWRFPARESPPSLTTLAARALVSITTAASRRRAEAGGTRGGGSGGDPADGPGVSHSERLESLPEELRDALHNLNVQAEVVL